MKILKKEKSKRNIFKVILAILFSVFTVLGYSYHKTNTWDLVFGRSTTIYKSCNFRDRILFYF